MNVDAIASIGAGLPAGFNPGALSAKSPAAQRKAVAGQFEAIMLRQLLGPSLSGMMGGDDTPSGSVYGYLLTDVFSQKIAQAGGLGLGKMIQQQLSPAGTRPAGSPAPAPGAPTAAAKPDLPAP